jgi:prephenate dehydratase
MRVAFQGETGAFSEEAALNFFSDEPVALLPLPTFENVFDRLEDGDADRAVIPIENSLHGSVHANYDLLRERDIYIVGELKMRIIHQLLGLADSSIDEITEVYSHPQALGQCQSFLRSKLPRAEAIPAYDTAGAAKMVAEAQVAERAAIASEAAAEEYNLVVLARGIESDHSNYTRFLVLNRAPYRPPAGVKTKTSIVYAMKENVPGALFKSLAVFALREIDLYKIESRPLVGSPWAYLFYLDISGAVGDEDVQRALDHLGEITAYLEILGSYQEGAVIE